MTKVCAKCESFWRKITLHWSSRMSRSWFVWYQRYISSEDGKEDESGLWWMYFDNFTLTSFDSLQCTSAIRIKWDTVRIVTFFKTDTLWLHELFCRTWYTRTVILYAFATNTVLEVKMLPQEATCISLSISWWSRKLILIQGSNGNWF